MNDSQSPNTGTVQGGSASQRTRTFTLTNGTYVDLNDDGTAEVAFPDGTIVEVPAGFADAAFASVAGRLAVNRRYPTYRQVGSRNGTEVRPDAFQFEGGIFPAQGQTLTAADYAELVSHPFYGSKFELVQALNIDPDDVARRDAMSDDELIAELQARADKGSAGAKRYLEAQGSYEAPQADGPVVFENDVVFDRVHGVEREHVDGPGEIKEHSPHDVNGHYATQDDGEFHTDVPTDVNPGARSPNDVSLDTPGETLPTNAPENKPTQGEPADGLATDGLATGVDRVTKANVDAAAETLLTYAREIGDSLTAADLTNDGGRGLSVTKVRHHAERLSVQFTGLDAADPRALTATDA